jgi:hypothetical protein
VSAILCLCRDFCKQLRRGVARVFGFDFFVRVWGLFFLKGENFILVGIYMENFYVEKILTNIIFCLRNLARKNLVWNKNLPIGVLGWEKIWINEMLGNCNFMWKYTRKLNFYYGKFLINAIWYEKLWLIEFLLRKHFG